VPATALASEATEWLPSWIGKDRRASSGTVANKERGVIPDFNQASATGLVLLVLVRGAVRSSGTAAA